MKGILVIGRSGQLARALAARAGSAGLAIEQRGRNDFDIGNLDAISSAIEAARPRIVINASAYTAVDKAEEEPELALRINAAGPAALARVCARIDAGLIHVSTDYVFNGSKPSSYHETDACAPINIYGRSKAEGEGAILAAGVRCAIIRTSWVFSSGPGNFVTTMLRLAGSRTAVSVVDDQVGRPTWASDLADACLTMAQRLSVTDSIGLVHFSGAGAPVSWCGFARAIFAGARARGLPTAEATPIPGAQYPNVARRPANSVLDTSRFSAMTGTEPRAWVDALNLCLDEIAAGSAPTQNS